MAATITIKVRSSVVAKVTISYLVSMVEEVGNRIRQIRQVLSGPGAYGNSTAQVSSGGMVDTIFCCRKNSAKRR